MSGEEKVEESDEGSLEFRSSTGIDCSWRKRFPYDGLADICSNEKIDTGTKTVTLL